MNTDTHKEKLLSILARVTGELETLGIHNPENPDDWIATPEESMEEADENIVADRVEDWDERASTLATLEKEYNDVKRALTKIEDGTYGVCELSGEQIEADRLDANPAARTCKAHMEEESTLP